MGVYDFFETRHRNPLGERLKKAQARRLLSIAGTLHPKASRVLELGPGDGYLAEAALSGKFQYKAIEGNKKLVDRLRRKGVDILHARMPPFPQDVGTFDLCFMLHIVEHLASADEGLEVLASCRTALARGGLIVVATPDYMVWRNEFFNCDYTHQVPYTQRRLRQMLTDAGYGVVHETRYSGLTFGALARPASLLPRALWSGIPQRIGALRHEMLYRGYLTFLPNLLTLATVR